MANSTQSIIISEPLCFLIHKHGRYPNQQLKALLFEFYSGDLLASAKSILLDSIENLKLDNFPKSLGRKRRDTKENPDVKIRLDIDDLTGMCVFLDENKLLTRLPTFVASNPDLIPSPRILEGDLAAVMRQLSKMDERMALMHTELETTRALVGKGRRVVDDKGGNGRGLEGAAGATSSLRLGSADVAPYSTTESRELVAIRKHTLAVRRLTESENVSSAQSECDPEDDPDSFLPNITRNVRRKRGQIAKSYASATADILRGDSARPVLASVSTIKPNAPSKKRVLMIGQSTTAAIKASKTVYVKKSVYRIGNVHSSNSADDLQKYIEQFGVRVVSCFDRAPVKLPNPQKDDENKTFRVCIFDADKDKLLCADNWSIGISIQRWIFKPKAETHAEASDSDSSKPDAKRTCSDESRPNEKTNKQADEPAEIMDSTEAAGESQKLI